MIDITTGIQILMKHANNRPYLETKSFVLKQPFVPSFPKGKRAEFESDTLPPQVNKK